MFIKLKRKLFNIHRLILIFLCFLFFYLILNLNKLKNLIDSASIEDDYKLRDFLISFIKNLDFNDLNIGLIRNQDYTKLLIKNLKIIDQIDYLDNNPNDFDNFKLKNQKSTNLQLIALDELNLDRFNLIQNNLHKFTTSGLLHFVIKIKNNQQFILNLDRFQFDQFRIVIVVQVHKRIFYLKLLIESLSKLTGIEDVLLIFSHDLFDLEINKLIEDVRFCKVIFQKK